MSAVAPESPRIVAATEAELPMIRLLAGEIWRACYPGIISAQQIEYMLERMYAADVLRRELREEGVRFWLVFAGAEAAGYAACGPTGRPGEHKLHKLYLRPVWHGRGWGRRLLAHCEIEARSAGAQRLILAVNKRNTRALALYQRNGFTVAESVTHDIGGGFVMDDFILMKPLTA